MTAVLSGVFGAGQQLLSNTGAILAGGKIYTYLAGSTTPAATWTDSTQLTQNANPLTLDAYGRCATEIWLANNTAYKFVITDSSGNPVGYTLDNIPGINASNVSQSEWVSGSTPTYISATSFSVPGNQVTTYNAARRVQYSVTSGTYYGTIVSSTYNGSTLTTVVITPDSTNLDASLSGVNYGFLNATPSSIPATTLTAGYVQNQTAVSFTTGGTSSAFTLTPAPVLGGYQAGQSFDVVFNATNASGATLNISGLGALPLVKVSYTGAYVGLTGGEVVSGTRSRCTVLAGATQIFLRDPIEYPVNETSSTGSAVLPSGTTAQRDSSPSLGFLRANSSNTQVEFWNGSAWVSVISGTLPTGSTIMPNGTTAQRDSSPAFGYTRANSQTNQMEWYNGSTWTTMGGGATGAGGDAAFQENDQLVTTSYTLGQGALLSGVTITIASPAVFTLANHGFVAGQPVRFTTTGALPTGLTAGAQYFVLAAGLTSSTFEVSTTAGGTAVNTSGSQSGTQSVGKCKDASSVGPITIASGATVTVPSGSRWVIL